MFNDVTKENIWNEHLIDFSAHFLSVSVEQIKSIAYFCNSTQKHAKKYKISLLFLQVKISWSHSMTQWKIPFIKRFLKTLFEFSISVCRKFERIYLYKIIIILSYSNTFQQIQKLLLLQNEREMGLYLSFTFTWRHRKSIEIIFLFHLWSSWLSLYEHENLYRALIDWFFRLLNILSFSYKYYFHIHFNLN